MLNKTTKNSMAIKIMVKKLKAKKKSKEFMKAIYRNLDLQEFQMSGGASVSGGER